MIQLVFAALALSAGAASAQTADTTMGQFRTFTADGAFVPTDALLDRAAQADVVFLGEIHDDPTGHAVELAVLQGLAARAAGRPVVLALEMFEADVQTSLDEYVSGLITERDFLAAARPWDTYADYRPLVEFARANGVRVVGSNAPVRYVRILSRGDSLAGLSPQALGWLPPLPVVPASVPVAAAFSQAMGGHGGDGMVGFLAAQNLRDASMAYRISEALRQPGRPLVVHVNGGFHTSGGRGIPEHLARYAPTAQTFNIQMEPVDSINLAPEIEAGVDAVIQTEARLVPSRTASPGMAP